MRCIFHSSQGLEPRTNIDRTVTTPAASCRQQPPSLSLSPLSVQSCVAPFVYLFQQHGGNGVRERPCLSLILLTVVVKFFHERTCEQLLTARHCVPVKRWNQMLHFLHRRVKHQLNDFSVVIIVDMTISFAEFDHSRSVFLFLLVCHAPTCFHAGAVIPPRLFLPVHNLRDLSLDDCPLVNGLHVETVTHLDSGQVLFPHPRAFIVDVDGQHVPVEKSDRLF